MAVASSFSVAPSLLRRPPPSSDSGSLAAASGLVAPAVKPSSGSFFSIPDVMSRAVRRWKRLVVAISGSGAAVAAVDPPAKASSSPTSHESSDDGRPFNYSSPPPFTIAEVRAAIPKRCWEKDAWRSLSYVIWDFAVVLSLAAAAAFFDSWLLWPLYWFAQGTMFWALFVLGHDCGHGSFSDSKSLNDFIGHVTHTAILVPFHGWRISHRTHHQNHGHVENDESWYPLTESLYRELDPVAKMSRFSPLSMLAYPIYLWRRSPGKFGSHFNPDSPLFQPSERNDVITSTTCWFAMISFLIGATIVAGPLWMFKLYFVPYLVNVIWLDFVTYLHHHGHEDKIPWYRGPEWSYLRGGLSTIDRDYGMFNHIQHDIGTHVVHHLFPQIPHYNLIEATAGARHVLGKFYRVPEKSGPFPFHLVRIYLKSLSRDHYVKDHGNILFYECDNPEAVKT